MLFFNKMNQPKKAIYPALQKAIKSLPYSQIDDNRKAVLHGLIDFIQHKVSSNQEVNLNFICTHNSRRSQFSQLWAQTAAFYFGIPANCFSGGVEETAFNKRAVAAIRRAGFKVTAQGEGNPRYTVTYAAGVRPLIMFSKVFAATGNPVADFAAVMTCADADENCPFISGAERRIPLRYDDPKEFDDTPQEADKYDERSWQIAAEMFYVFSKIIN
jgi:arsenate reductase (thioredoxin)